MAAYSPAERHLLALATAQDKDGCLKVIFKLEKIRISSINNLFSILIRFKHKARLSVLLNHRNTFECLEVFPDMLVTF